MRVRLDPESIKDVSIWVRGRSEAEIRRRGILNPRKGIVTTVAVFNRIAFVASLKKEQSIHVRLFKDIPIRDLEALLPHAHVRMNRKDAAFMVGGATGAAWSVIAKLTIASVAAATQLLWVLAVPLAGLSWKIFSGYRRALKDRDSHRARHLYYQTLGANLSAIHRLASMISEEEIKEAVLLYAFCSREVLGKLAPESFADLERLIQSYLRERTGITCDFDMDDAVETLDRLDLWEDREKLRALPPEQAAGKLEEHWTELGSENYHAGLLGITG
jgi:hypothetical protein